MSTRIATIALHNLSHSDGSALYLSPSNTHVLQSAVHYPVEVPYRSNEIPTDTYIEVSVRPSNGIPMVKEQHIAQSLQKILRSLVLGEETPRCMLQVTIQVMETETDEALSGGIKSGGQGEEYLDLLVGAVNSAVMACLDGGVQMRRLAGAVLLGVTPEHEIIVSPHMKERKNCSSLHAFAYDSKRKCIFMESEGMFGMEDWENAESLARHSVCGGTISSHAGANGDSAMEGESDEALCMLETMRRSVEARVMGDERWKS